MLKQEMMCFIIHLKKQSSGDSKEKLPYLIIKNCNVTNKVMVALKKYLGDCIIMKTYFSNGDLERDLYAGTCNLEVLKVILYNQYVKTSTKLINKYVVFYLHPQNKLWDKFGTKKNLHRTFKSERRKRRTSMNSK